MSIWRYAGRCRGVAEELKESLSGDEYEEVFDALGQYTVAEWYQWRHQHSEQVVKLAVATPKPRQKLLAGMQGEQKILMVFAACQYCHEAAAFLEAADRAMLLPGMSYRKTVGAANDLFAEAKTDFEAFWPWGGTPSFPVTEPHTAASPARPSAGFQTSIRKP